MTERYLVIFTVVAGLLVYLAYLTRKRKIESVPISEWFRVSFDEMKVEMFAQPPGRKPWQQSFLWSEIIRVCFKSEGLYTSDGMYVFTTQRPESFVIPTEASGGIELWTAFIERGLFPEELATKVMTTPEGATECWPRLPGAADG